MCTTTCHTRQLQRMEGEGVLTEWMKIPSQMKPRVLNVIHEWGGDGMCWCVFGAGWGGGGAEGAGRLYCGCVWSHEICLSKFVFVVIAWSQLFTSGWLPHVGRCLAYGRYFRNSDAKEAEFSLKCASVMIEPFFSVSLSSWIQGKCWSNHIS